MSPDIYENFLTSDSVIFVFIVLNDFLIEIKELGKLESLFECEIERVIILIVLFL